MKVNRFRKLLIPAAIAAALAAPIAARAAVFVQCPGDTNGDAQWTGSEVRPPNTYCKHLTGGDGFATMADGRVMYIFGFDDITGTPPAQVVLDLARANWNSPTIELTRGRQVLPDADQCRHGRCGPDLFDPHSVHFHGFPQRRRFSTACPSRRFTPNMGSA